MYIYTYIHIMDTAAAELLEGPHAVSHVDLREVLLRRCP